MPLHLPLGGSRALVIRYRAGSWPNSDSSYSKVPRRMSWGTSRCTGPGRPVNASRNPQRTSSGIRRPSWTAVFHLVMGRNTDSVSISANMPRAG